MMCIIYLLCLLIITLCSSLIRSIEELGLEDPVKVLTFRSPAEKSNIFFIKTPKVGGSTVGGVVRRIADHYGLSGAKFYKIIDPEPGIWANHNPYITMEEYHRNLKLPTFLFTFIRHPIERALSYFYHIEASRHQKEITPERKLAHLKKTRDEQFNYLRQQDIADGIDPVDAVVGVYDFIGITERFQESMILLSIRLNVTMCDILYLKAKDSRSGQLDDQGIRMIPHLALTEEPEIIQKYARNDFIRNNMKDMNMYNLSLSMLDAQIQYLGEQRFRTAVIIYTRKLLSAQKECSGQIGPGSCYWNDNGCGYKCLDKLCKIDDELNRYYPFT